jgi:hypothetical protein
LACGWHVIFFANNTVLDIALDIALDAALDAALDMALTQLQFPLLVASFIFLAFARSSAAERFLAPGSPTY